MANEKNCCPTCGASMKVHNQRLSKGLAKLLIQFKGKVLELNRNEIHLQKDLRLTNNQFGNFQKLRYHGLIAKVYDKETKLHKGGYWLLTKKGNQFLKSEISTAQSVFTFRNKIVDKSPSKVFLSEVLNDESLPIWDDYNYAIQYQDNQEFN
jgi:hypothetical protein